MQVNILPKYSPVFVLSCFSRPLDIVNIFVPLSIVKVLNLSSLKTNIMYEKCVKDLKIIFENS